jgi:Zn-dependent protease with chaperone function
MDKGKTEAETKAAMQKAEKAFRRSLELEPNFGRTHMQLATVLFMQEDAATPVAQRAEAQAELDRARKLDPTPPIRSIEAQAAMKRGQFPQAETLLKQELLDAPNDADLTRMLVICLVINSKGTNRSTEVKALLDRFPNDGGLICWYGAALAVAGDAHGGVRELNRARTLGTDPTTVLPPDLVRKIEEAGAPGWAEQVGWVMLGFAVFYAAVMLLMAFAGIILASFTRGSHALDLLGAGSGELVDSGQVLRTRHESILTRVYALGLFAGLILFYLSIPFIVVGLLAGTGLLLYLIFSMGRIPVKLVVLVAVVGLGGVWAVLKGLFSSPGKGSFGLAKTREQTPKLYSALAEVARRVDTNPVDEVFIAPGASIGVHQEGRGPFGMFGVKNRVLTLGLSTMHYLSLGELKAILAHEYAHFSHSDTFYSRFIYQVQLSIQQTLNGMGASGGHLNYVNPFYWFLYLYHKAYTLLSSGFSRSREYLADRMACTLYGPDTFTRALSKVSTDGTLFEMTIYDNIGKLLDEDRAFVNMYTAFRTFRDEQISGKDREELYEKLLAEKESLFASHPTFKERIDAVAQLPAVANTETEPALSLFDNVEELEKELTDFMTGYIQYMRHLQAQAAAAQG